MKRQLGTSKAPVKATPVADALVSEIDGAFQFKGGYIRCICPCGCGGFMNLPVYQTGTAKERTPSWEWDGNETTPTLKPSIRDLSGCRFHGFLTAGVWTFCSDSGVVQ